MLEIEMARFLLSAEGRSLLTQADRLRAARVETLPALMRLRRIVAPEQATAAWEMSELRQRGVAKFGPMAAQMYFVREALEQASSARASAYHASRFAKSEMMSVADLCGGIGGDALALARQGRQVTLYELDPVRTMFAQENAVVHSFGGSVRVIRGDSTVSPIEAEAVWFDPARRQDHRRVSDPDDYLPPLSFVETLAAQEMTHVGVKLSPAIDHALAARYGAELEFLSDGGECKEALLWLGKLQQGRPLSATKLTDRGPISLTGTPDEDLSTMADTGNGRYLYEPDPAAIRAHLVQTLAAQLAAAPIFPQIAYLIGDELIGTPWAAAYEIVERLPYHRRRLQEALTAHDVGRVVIKKRGFPQEPDEVRKQLKLKGTREMTVVLTRAADGHQAVLCRPIRTESGL